MKYISKIGAEKGHGFSSMSTRPKYFPALGMVVLIERAETAGQNSNEINDNIDCAAIKLPLCFQKNSSSRIIFTAKEVIMNSSCWYNFEALLL